MSSIREDETLMEIKSDFTWLISQEIENILQNGKKHLS